MAKQDNDLEVKTDQFHPVTGHDQKSGQDRNMLDIYL